MTNEQVIDELSVLHERMQKAKEEGVLSTMYYDGQYVDALDMAIKALEQQPCEDWYDVPSDEMTLEQARQAVKDLRKKLSEVLEPEQQPCDDCISRKETIEWLKKVTVTDGITFKTGFEQILQDIEQMPSVTPTYDLEEYSTKLWKLAYERGKAEGEQRNG